MSLLDKPFQNIVEADLTGLIDNKVVERKTLEYKLGLPGNKDAERKEFLADVSSFANAAGGLLFYGIESKDGIPTQLVGIERDRVDAEKLRIEGMTRDGIAPRIISVRVEDVPLTSGKSILAISIPKSIQAPHMVTFGNHAKFYTRNSSGKYQMDVFELRNAFRLFGNLTEQIREFRLYRTSKIISGELPIQLLDEPPIVIHSVPLLTFDSITQVDPASLESRINELEPIKGHGGVGWSPGYNLDGFMSFSSLPEGTVAYYMQIFRNGAIEVVDTLTLSRGQKQIPHDIVEREIIDNVERLVTLQRSLGITPPLAIFISLLKIKDFEIPPSRFFPLRKQTKIVDNDLLFREIIIENDRVDYPSLLKPTFDTLWNAAGWARSRNYDEQGKRKDEQL